MGFKCAVLPLLGNRLNHIFWIIGKLGRQSEKVRGFFDLREKYVIVRAFDQRGIICMQMEAAQ